MKIYDIEYNFEKEVEYEAIETLPGALQGEFDTSDMNELESDEFEIINSHMQIGSVDFQSATMEAIDMLDEVFGDDNYDILGIVELQGLDILNWPGEHQPCDCPQCQAKEMADEDVMVFNCPDCDNEMRVPIDSWNLVLCRKCECEILRSGVISLGNNKYKYLKLEDKNNDKEGG